MKSHPKHIPAKCREGMMQKKDGKKETKKRTTTTTPVPAMYILLPLFSFIVDGTWNKKMRFQVCVCV